jgi:D-3-phosphoglycerate dehydrogenase
MTYQIHCLNKISTVGTTQLTSGYQITGDVAEADGILVRSANMHEMGLTKKLLAVARAGAGVNNIPLDRCSDAGVVVFNTPGANANAVKELAIAGMLLASRDILGGVQWVQSAKEDAAIAKLVEKEKSRFAGTELAGKKLGVIGLGAIGAKIATAAVHLGMQVYGYDPYISVEAAWSLSREVKHIKSLDLIYSECDYITIHVPAVEGTIGMINKDTVAQMKEGVIILNFARDLLVNDEDMAEALKSGKVKQYITDFPNPATAKMEHTILIPHLGASTEEAEDNCAKMAVDQMMDYLENGNIKNSVNFPSCDMGICTKAGRIAVLHMNVPHMLSKFTGVCAAENINISDLMNKSKGKYAYTMMDLDSPVSDGFAREVSQIGGVRKVRVIR